MKKTFLTVLALFFIIVATTIAAEFSADEITMMAGRMEGKVYYKNADIHRNESMGMIRIMKRPFVYQLFPDTKKYMVKNVDKLMKKSKNPMAGASFKDIIKKNNLKKVGTQMIQNYNCDIYEGDIVSGKSKAIQHMKIWYSKKLEYAIRTDMTLPAPMGTLSTQVENIRIGKQPNNLFEVPPEYSEAKSIHEAMGM